MKSRKLLWLGILLPVSAAILGACQNLLVPKYMGRVIEGAFIREYYEETEPHDVIFLGDCEAYENVSPIVLWREYGITSFIRGSAQQLIPQSYYLLEDTLTYETPAVVVLSVSAMQQYEQDNETYNRMTLDGMRWSASKVNAIRESMTEDEHMIEYVFPILRFHSRWRELEEDDFTYFLERREVTHSGYYMRADIRPAGEFPAERRRSTYAFDDRAWAYLDKIRLLCREKGITLILMKAPSLYPAWHEQWDQQIRDYAKEHQLLYVNCIDRSEDIGIDFTVDTYDGGLHMNVYGAEKTARYLGKILAELPAAKDRREADGGGPVNRVWEEKCRFYDQMKAAQEAEFEELGYLRQFAEEPAD
ncbi:MAG: SGNH/GDSL hydrolase family protein [Hungatella sp.]|nr:SGNH/GDSL hydrolase family protein [Hungatella sp.]